MPEDKDSQQDKKSEEDLDRELIELLNELRVALPGVQVLFAFLLTVPFTQRFARVTETQQDAYLVALLATLAGSVFLIAPSAYHRIQWRQRDKEQMLRTSNRLALAGGVFLAIGMTASVFLIADLILKQTATAILTAAAAGLFAWVWYGLPLLRRLRG
ncbi:MAG: DUF6328 family protein [Actinomycetota bacterium]|nr:DUF6328 family protein [Actinomycetota bacterium]